MGCAARGCVSGRTVSNRSHGFTGKLIKASLGCARSYYGAVAQVTASGWTAGRADSRSEVSLAGGRCRTSGGAYLTAVSRMPIRRSSAMLGYSDARLGLRLACAVRVLRVGDCPLRPWPAGGAFRAGGLGQLSFEGPGRLCGPPQFQPRSVWSSANAALHRHHGSIPRVRGNYPLHRRTCGVNCSQPALCRLNSPAACVFRHLRSTPQPPTSPRPPLNRRSRRRRASPQPGARGHPRRSGSAGGALAGKGRRSNWLKLIGCLRCLCGDAV